MTATTRRTGVRRIAVAVMTLFLLAPSQAQPLPPSGVWDVVKVAVDRRGGGHGLYEPDDLRLSGRELVLGERVLTFNDGSDPCDKPMISAREAPLRKLLADSFPRSPGPGTAAVPTLGDFGLPQNLDARVTAYTPRCAPRSDGRYSQPWSETWFIVIAPDRLLMRIGTSALLTLARRAPDAVPQPSFACSAARSAIERLLCGSVPLAALDRSLAAAYKRKGETADPAALRAEQAEWLKRRDACGQNETCVADAMRERIDELMQN